MIHDEEKKTDEETEGGQNISLYSIEPTDKVGYTEHFDHTYTRIAYLYNWFIKLFPIWKNWLNRALPHIQGPRVLEISFGTGYLLTQYAHLYPEVHGVEYNKKLLQIAQQNLSKSSNNNNSNVRLVHGNVEDLPYSDNYFDTVIITMAFSGYPDGHRAMKEIHRVLKSGSGRLVMIDVNFPKDGEKNRIGMFLAKMWQMAGDILRDMDHLLEKFGFDYTDEEIGGFGSVHLYVASKRA